MKTYVIYLNGREVGLIKAGSHNTAEAKARARYAHHLAVGADISVAYTEV